MLDDVRDHFLAFLRQRIGAPVEGSVARVLRNIEKLAAELLKDVVAPESDPGALQLYDLVGAAFSPPRWDFTRISGSHGIGDLLHTIGRVGASRGRNEGSQVNQDDVQKWYRAALGLRYCLEIREHGLTRHNFDLLAQAVCRMPITSTSKQQQLMGRFLVSGARPAARCGAEQPHSSDIEPPESEPRSSLTKQAVDMPVGAGQTRKRLTIDREARRVLIDGSVQPVTAQPFGLLVLLAQSTVDGKGPVDNRILESTMRGRPAKQTISELRNALKANRNNALEIHNWIVARRSFGGFELVLPAEHIEIRS